MTKNKLQKFQELLTFPNVYENFNPEDPKLVKGYEEEFTLVDGWCADHFKNDHPLVLELACGRGEYTVALAERYPDINFMGLDIKGARLWKGAKYALENGLHNAAFLRTRIEQLRLFFRESEIDEIWITFPDPFLKKENKRLTSPRFLAMYYPLLKPEARIHLKTDSEELYEFTLEVLEEEDLYSLQSHSSDIYAGTLPHEDLDIKTYYEHMHLEEGKKIKYIDFSKKAD